MTFKNNWNLFKRKDFVFKTFVMKSKLFYFEINRAQNSTQEYVGHILKVLKSISKILLRVKHTDKK